VNVEVHVADAVVPDSVHVVKDPVTPVSLRLTVPVGVVGVDDVSVTVTVQVEPWLITTGVVQLTVVVVVWSGTVVTAMMNVPLLPE
jgi:hypothetical protein